MKNLKKILLTSALLLACGAVGLSTAAVTRGAHKVSAYDASFIGEATEIAEFGTDLVLNTAKVKKFTNEHYFYNIDGDDVYYFAVDNGNQMEARFATPGSDFNLKTADSLGTLTMATLSFDLKVTANAGDTEHRGWFVQGLEINNDHSAVAKYAKYDFNNHYDGEWHSIVIDIATASKDIMGGFTLKYDTADGDAEAETNIPFTGEVMVKNIAVSTMSIKGVQSVISDGVGASSEFVGILIGGCDWDNYSSKTGTTSISSSFTASTTNYGTHVLVNGVTYNDYCAAKGKEPLAGELFFNLFGKGIGVYPRYADLSTTEITIKAGFTVPSGAYMFDGAELKQYTYNCDITFKSLVKTTSETVTRFVAADPFIETTTISVAQIRTPGGDPRPTDKFIAIGIGNQKAYDDFVNNEHVNIRAYMGELVTKTIVHMWDGNDKTLGELADYSQGAIRQWGEILHFVHLDPNQISGTGAKVIRAIEVLEGAAVYSKDGRTKFVVDANYNITHVRGEMSDGGFDYYGSRWVHENDSVWNDITKRVNKGTTDAKIVTDGKDHIGVNGIWVNYESDATPNTSAHYTTIFHLNTLGKILVNGVRINELEDYKVSGDITLNKWARAFKGMYIGLNNSFDYRNNALEVTIEAGCELPGGDDCIQSNYTGGHTISYYTVENTTTYRLLPSKNGYGNKTAADALVALLHMDSTTENQCLTLYGDAKTAYNALDANTKELFSADSIYADAYARLSAWAAAHGEKLESGKTISKIEVISVINNNSSMIIVGFAVASLLAFGVFFITKKKKIAK